MVEFQRPVAYKIWISDLLNGSYTSGTGQFDAGYVEIFGMKISKVNIIGGIVDKFKGETYENINVDDGSGILSLKLWGEDVKLFSDLNLGDLVLVIGKVKEYNNRIFVVPEVLKKLDNPLWLKVRKLELINKYGETKRVETKKNEDEPGNKFIIEDVVDEKADKTNSRSVILDLIEKLDFGDGADINEVMKRSSFNEADEVVQELLRDGEVFELHKGKLRVMG